MQELLNQVTTTLRGMWQYRRLGVLVAWFVAMPLQLAIGIVPTYWAMKMIWAAAAGERVVGYGLAGLVVNAAVLAVLLTYFGRRVRRR